jgi:hypothetical protein
VADLAKGRERKKRERGKKRHRVVMTIQPVQSSSIANADRAIVYTAKNIHPLSLSSQLGAKK